MITTTNPFIQVEPDYRFLVVSIVGYDASGSRQEDVVLNEKARDLLDNHERKIEGKLGGSRPGRAEYENQAGERDIFVWEALNACPSDLMLKRIGYMDGSTKSLFVTPKKDNPTECESWVIPVMQVDSGCFRILNGFVETRFTNDSNALPPVYMRVSNHVAEDSTVLLELSARVKRWSFDCIAQEPIWAAGEPGLSATWHCGESEEVSGSVADTEIPVTAHGGCQFALVRNEPQAGAGGGVDVSGGVGGGTTEATPQIFVLEQREYDRFVALVTTTDDFNDAGSTSIFFAVRYAAPLGSVRDRSFLRTPLTPAGGDENGRPVNRKEGKNVLWKVLNIFIKRDEKRRARRTVSGALDDRAVRPPSPPPPPPADSSSEGDFDSASTNLSVHEDPPEEESSSDEEVGTIVGSSSVALPVTMNEVEKYVIPCLPEQCVEPVRVALKSILATQHRPNDTDDVVEPDVLKDIVELLKGLAALSSVIVMVPFDSVASIREAIRSPQTITMVDNHALNAKLTELCPAVRKVMCCAVLLGCAVLGCPVLSYYPAHNPSPWSCSVRFCLFSSVLFCYVVHAEQVLVKAGRNHLLFEYVSSFMEGLCGFVDDLVLCGIEPPGFQPMKGSYHPEATGMAFRMSPSGERGRVSRRYVTEDKVTDTCNKKFGSTRGRTGGIFSFFCAVHGLALGSSIIPKAESRRDPFLIVYLHCKDAPLKLVFDFACGLLEYAMNREPLYWLRCR